MGTQYLLDSSFTNLAFEQDIVHLLYKGVRGLNTISNETPEKLIERIVLLEKHMKGSILLAISEVVDELSTGLTLLNNNCRFIAVLREKSYHERKKHKHNVELEEGSEETFELIRSYADKMYAFIRRLQNKDPRLNFNEHQHEIYKSLVEFLATQESPIKKWKEERKIVYGETDSIRDISQTDKKLAATGVTLAYDSPITVLTRDQNIKLYLTAVIKEYSEGILHLSIPSNPITIENELYEHRISFTNASSTSASVQ